MCVLRLEGDDKVWSSYMLPFSGHHRAKIGFCRARAPAWGILRTLRNVEMSKKSQTNARCDM